MKILRIMAVGAAVLLLFAAPAPAQSKNDESEKAIIKERIEAAIGWALNKDFDLLEDVFAHDPNLFIFHPDSKSTVVGWNQFKQRFPLWADPRFKVTSFEVKDLRINISRSGDVAWFSCLLDDLAEFDGRKVGWENVRRTGVLEKREGKWVIVQTHLSFPNDLQKEEAPEQEKEK